MAERDKSGKFLTGNSGGPGRPTRAHETAVLDALRGSFPPERLIAALEDALQIAQSQNSARGMLAVVEFIASYVIGKPVPHVEKSSTNAIDYALARLAAMRSSTSSDTAAPETSARAQSNAVEGDEESESSEIARMMESTPA